MSQAKQRVVLFADRRQLDASEVLLIKSLARHPECGELYVMTRDQPRAAAHTFQSYERSNDGYKTIIRSTSTRAARERHKDVRASLRHEVATYVDQLKPVRPEPMLAYKVDIAKLETSDYLDNIGSKVEFNARDGKGLSSHDMDMVVDIDAIDSNGARALFPRAFMVNHPENAKALDDKCTLPDLRRKIGEVVAPSWKVENKDQILDSLERCGGDIVVKTGRGVSGQSVWRITYEPGYEPHGTKDERLQHVRVRSARGQQSFRDFETKILKHGELVCQPFLDTDKGDVRVIGVNGKIMGAYVRMPEKTEHGTNWIANTAERGTMHPFEFSAHDKQRVEHALRYLADKQGLHYVSFDLLADKQGNRCITEASCGLATGFEIIDQYEKQGIYKVDKPIADRMADGIFSAFHKHATQPNVAILRKGKGELFQPDLF